MLLNMRSDRIVPEVQDRCNRLYQIADILLESARHFDFHRVAMYYPMRMVRTREYKLIVNLAHPLEYPSASDLWGSDMWQGVLKRGDKMMGSREVKAFLHRPKEELYDMTADPNELKNLAADPAFAKTLEDLRGKLATWREKTNDPWLIKDKHE